MDIIIKNGVIKQKKEVQQNIYKDEYNFQSFHECRPGPYYDPRHVHQHIWRKPQLIPNFQGEQLQNSKTLKTTLDPPTTGLYCVICHCRRIAVRYSLGNKPMETLPAFKRSRVGDIVQNFKNIQIKRKKNSKLLWDRFYYLLHKKAIDKVHSFYLSLKAEVDRKVKITNKWRMLSERLTAPDIYYQINSFTSIRLKEKDMTLFQKFRYNNMNYKNDFLFVVKNDKFQENYAIVQ